MYFMLSVIIDLYNSIECFYMMKPLLSLFRPPIQQLTGL